MSSITRTIWLSRVLRLLSPRLLAALDAWSYRIALRRAEQRRLAAGSRQPVPTLAQPSLKPD